MADSKRQQVVAALVARLKLITTANGYETSLGSRVYEWMVAPAHESILPAIIVKDVSVEISDDSNIGRHDHTLTAEIHCLCEGSTAPAQMRKFAADVYKAIGTDTKFGGLALLTHPVSDKTEMEQAERLVSATTITALIQYRTGAWNPYQ